MGPTGCRSLRLAEAANVEAIRWRRGGGPVEQALLLYPPAVAPRFDTCAAYDGPTAVLARTRFISYSHLPVRMWEPATHMHLMTAVRRKAITSPPAPDSDLLVVSHSTTVALPPRWH